MKINLRRRCSCKSEKRKNFPFWFYWGKRWGFVVSGSFETDDGHFAHDRIQAKRRHKHNTEAQKVNSILFYFKIIFSSSWVLRDILGSSENVIRRLNNHGRKLKASTLRTTYKSSTPHFIVILWVPEIVNTPGEFGKWHSGGKSFRFFRV